MRCAEEAFPGNPDSALQLVVGSTEAAQPTEGIPRPIPSRLLVRLSSGWIRIPGGFPRLKDQFLVEGRVPRAIQSKKIFFPKLISN